MKWAAEEMVIFELDYGDLMRPDFEIVYQAAAWAAHERTGEYLIGYGPRHQKERSIFDTPPYVLPPAATTQDRWDFDGFLVSSDRLIRRFCGAVHSPSSSGIISCSRCTKG